MAGTKKATAAPDVRATLHNVEILGGRHLKRRILETMVDGSFEKPEIDAGLGCIKPGDRVIEMGAGSGTVGAILTKNIPDVQIMSFEANPNLLPAINELYAQDNRRSGKLSQSRARTRPRRLISLCARISLARGFSLKTTNPMSKRSKSKPSSTKNCARIFATMS